MYNKDTRKILVLSLLSTLLVSCDITIRNANSVTDNQNNQNNTEEIRIIQTYHNKNKF